MLPKLILELQKLIFFINGKIKKASLNSVEQT